MTARLTPNNTEKTCYHLGFIHDDKTATGYPSAQNFCHQCEPPNTPNMAHQREYCLSQKFKECQVFAATKVGPMPKEMAMDNPREIRKSRKMFTWIVALVILAGLAAAAWFLLPILGINLTAFFIVPNESATSLPVITAETPTVTLTLKPTATQAPPTLTPTPPTPHALETPFGLKQQLIVHQVRDGENLTSMAATFSTTVDAIKAINVMVDTLQVNSLLVIPVGQTDVTDLSQVKIVKVDQPTTTLGEIAKEYSVDIELLTKINQLPESCVFKAGDWVLIPVVTPAQ